MYRHFALVTVLLTATVAMFAEGESRQAQAAPAAVAVPASPAAPRIAASQLAPEPAPDWWELDSSPDGEIGAGDGEGGESSGFEEVDVSGHSPEYVASLNEDERELLLAGMQESGVLDPAVRESRSADLAAASSRRSGSASAGD